MTNPERQTEEPRRPEPNRQRLTPEAKLVVGLLGRDAELLSRALALLEREYGRIDARSSDIRFDFTNYYEAEFGPGLLRRWVGIGGLVAQDRLADLKLAAGKLERKLAAAGRRTVNIDPGLLTPHSLVLATTKANAHRIYLRDGIYAELTLRYHAGRFEPLVWTYPDYRSAACLDFLARCREKLAEMGNHQGTKTPDGRQTQSGEGAGPEAD
jgi:hypothetical protein